MSARALLAPLGLALAAVALFALDARLDARAAAEHAAAPRLGPLVTPAERDALSIAALRVERGDGTRWFYARADGVWRCVDAWGALAGEARIAALVETLLDTAGTLEPVPDEELDAWGFGTPDTLVLTLHGPGARPDDVSADVQLRVELGRALPSVDGGFARRPGDDGVRRLDTNLRALLEPDAGGTPLLDRTLVGQANWTSGRRMGGALVVRRDGTTFRLVEQPSGATEEQLARGASPFLHVVVEPDGSVRPTVGVLVTSFEVFLATAEWERLLDPATAREHGISDDGPRLVVQRDDGRNLGFVLGDPLPDGGVPVLITASRQLVVVAPQVAEALQPAPEAFVPGAPGNLWDPWLGRPRD